MTAISLLYVSFFLIWCVGLLLGFLEGMPTLFGVPLWFLVSCVLSYVLICVALVRVVRRYFK